MVRPKIKRKICINPDYRYFKPRGIPIVELQEIEIKIDELEAIRLADLEGLYHSEASKKMNISRQTFGNILASAHKKIADFLVNSRALKIV